MPPKSKSRRRAAAAAASAAKGDDDDDDARASPPRAAATTVTHGAATVLFRWKSSQLPPQFARQGDPLPPALPARQQQQQQQQQRGQFTLRVLAIHRFLSDDRFDRLVAPWAGAPAALAAGPAAASDPAPERYSSECTYNFDIVLADAAPHCRLIKCVLLPRHVALVRRGIMYPGTLLRVTEWAHRYDDSVIAAQQPRPIVVLVDFAVVSAHVPAAAAAAEAAALPLPPPPAQYVHPSHAESWPLVGVHRYYLPVLTDDCFQFAENDEDRAAAIDAAAADGEGDDNRNQGQDRALAVVPAAIPATIRTAIQNHNVVKLSQLLNGTRDQRLAYNRTHILIARVVDKTRVSFFGRRSRPEIKKPFQYGMLLDDASTSDMQPMPVVLWNDVCVDTYGIIRVGDIVAVERYSFKTDRDTGAVEMQLNPRQSVVCRLSPEMVGTGSQSHLAADVQRLPPLPSSIVPTRDLVSIADGHRFDLCGLIVYASAPTRVWRSRRLGDQERPQWLRSRWVRIVDHTSRTSFAVRLYTNSGGLAWRSLRERQLVFLTNIIAVTSADSQDVIAYFSDPTRRSMYGVSTKFTEVIPWRSRRGYTRLLPLAVSHGSVRDHFQALDAWSTAVMERNRNQGRAGASSAPSSRRGGGERRRRQRHRRGTKEKKKRAAAAAAAIDLYSPPVTRFGPRRGKQVRAAQTTGKAKAANASGESSSSEESEGEHERDEDSSDATMQRTSAATAAVPSWAEVRGFPSLYKWQCDIQSDDMPNIGCDTFSAIVNRSRALEHEECALGLVQGRVTGMRFSRLAHHTVRTLDGEPLEPPVGAAAAREDDLLTAEDAAAVTNEWVCAGDAASAPSRRPLCILRLTSLNGDETLDVGILADPMPFRDMIDDAVGGTVLTEVVAELREEAMARGSGGGNGQPDTCVAVLRALIRVVPAAQVARDQWRELSLQVASTAQEIEKALLAQQQQQSGSDEDDGGDGRHRGRGSGGGRGQQKKNKKKKMAQSNRRRLPRRRAARRMHGGGYRSSSSSSISEAEEDEASAAAAAAAPASGLLDEGRRIDEAHDSDDTLRALYAELEHRLTVALFPPDQMVVCPVFMVRRQRDHVEGGGGSSGSGMMAGAGDDRALFRATDELGSDSDGEGGARGGGNDGLLAMSEPPVGVINRIVDEGVSIIANAVRVQARDAFMAAADEEAGNGEGAGGKIGGGTSSSSSSSSDRGGEEDERLTKKRRGGGERAATTAADRYRKRKRRVR